MALFLLVSLSFIATACATIEFRHVTLPRRSTEFATIPQAEYSIPLTTKVPRRQVKKDVLRLLQGGNSTSAVLAGSDFDQEYLVNVTVGGQEFALIFDTGSSDTWLAEVNFTCTDLNSQVQLESECAFGPLYSNTSSTFSSLPNLNFNITYGDGEFLLGTVANETITVGGLTVEQQEIGVVYNAAWEGDGINSGLIGFAHPNLTSVYPGDDPANDIANATYFNHITYDPFFFSAVREGAVSAPFFSVALNRGTFDEEDNDTYDPNLGYLAFGGLPPVPVTNISATVPVQGYQSTDFSLPSNASNSIDFYYTVDIQAITFPKSDQLDTFNDNTILDTGTTLNYFPTEVFKLYASAFDPPAQFSDTQGGYITLCNATVPEFSVTIGGSQFYIDPRDQLLPVGNGGSKFYIDPRDQLLPGGNDGAGNPTCFLGTQDGGEAINGRLFILGDTFLHNVVVTFNIQSNEVTITQREKY